MAKGYGMYRYEAKFERAHRLAWKFVNGAIPEGAMVCHRCDVRNCINPSHLFLGDNSTNMLDMFKKGRGNRPKGSAHKSSKLTESDVLTIRTLRQAGSSVRSLSEAYGVSTSAIWFVVNRRNWKHVDQINEHRDQKAA